MLQIPGIVKSIFDSFPTKEYGSLALNDDSLMRKLDESSYEMASSNDLKLVCDGIIEVEGQWLASDPHCLFVQFSILHKFFRMQNEKSTMRPKDRLIICEREALPLLLDGSHVVLRDDLLEQLNLNFTPLELQYSRLLDTVIDQWQQQLNDKKHDQNALADIHFKKILSRFESELNAWKPSYFEFKLAATIISIKHAPETEVSQFIRSNCSNLDARAEKTLLSIVKVEPPESYTD